MLNRTGSHTVFSVNPASRSRDIQTGFAVEICPDLFEYKKITEEEINQEITQRYTNTALFFGSDINALKQSISVKKTEIKKAKRLSLETSSLENAKSVLEESLEQFQRMENQAKDLFAKPGISGDIHSALSLWNTLSEDEMLLLKTLISQKKIELMYVMPAPGSLTVRLRPHKIRAPHPTITAGINPVVCASGNMQLTLESGRLVISEISADSAHFKPDPECAASVILQYFEQHPEYLSRTAVFRSFETGPWWDEGLRIIKDQPSGSPINLCGFFSERRHSKEKPEFEFTDSQLLSP